MEDYISNAVVGTHLLQHTLRSLCHEKSIWSYAVFWRTLPRIYPPPNWDLQRGAYKMTRENRRNWMLAWEDGFCNFYASAAENCDVQHCNGLPPELFFRMSHEIHNYGEDVFGKVAAERGHICIHSEQHNLSALQNSEDLHPKTWRAQFQSGIKTIALIAVDDGHVLQLGAIEKVTEDLSYVIQLQKKFKYLLSIPGFLLPHPSYSTLTCFPLTNNSIKIQHPRPFNHVSSSSRFNDQPVMMTTPSMSSLETLLLKLPAVLVPAGSLLSPPPLFQFHESPPWFSSSENPHEEVVMGMEQIAKHALD
ncbi:hypothetical protein EZV62_022838 [Acer yangbiense]|uniref:Transcription factor MYC/MYB N-terminal domain-containing protein n=1 Tax=Acer yangbiense TaxID=1000413 RepID=A0A5C7GZV2_9ROSI|nr:hypothetical protein EZV62_022838 [Acer yangbiense]